MDITGFAVNMLSDFLANLNSIHSAEAIIFDIAIILIVSALFAFIAKMLRQPLIPAYVLAGLIIGPLVLGLVSNAELMYAFAEIGIAFLLFTAGLEISIKKIKEANLVKIGLIGTLQVGIIFAVGLFAGGLFNLTMMQAVYIGIIMAFGSTMVVIKLLADKKELVTLHGRLILGILLLQDLFAIFAIVILMSESFTVAPIAIALFKLFLILGIAFLLHLFLLKPLFRFAARSTELLLLSSLAVLFLFVILTYLTNLSIVIGAFIAGVALANSQFKYELESRISPLRDFFSILFFVALGMQIVFAGVSFSLFLFLVGVAIFLKPLITILLLRLFSYRPQTSLLTGISLAQLSEFSLIIGVLGLTLGALTTSIFSTIILATITTMALTTYFIEYKNELASFLRKPLNLFKWLPVNEVLDYIDEEEKKILLVGSHRMGSILMKALSSKQKKQLVVIDHNPEIVNSLRKKKISTIYGDLASTEILDNINVAKLNLTVSTVPSYEGNRLLLRKIRKRHPKARVILTATRISEALDLYREGADYVILPKVLAGEELIRLIRKEKGDLKDVRKRHIKLLNEVHNILY